MPTSICLLRGSAAEWAENDLVLPAGEPALCTDDKSLRIGDGVHAFSALPLYREASPNLLLNADFALTRNSRALTTYTAPGPCIDAWKKGTYGEVSVEAGGVTVSTDESIAEFTQVIECGLARLIGREMTLSAIVNGALFSSTFTVQVEPGSWIDLGVVCCNGSSFFSLAYNGFDLFARFIVVPDYPLTINAVKLEFGSASTLAISRDTEPTLTGLACDRLLRVSYPAGVAPGTPAAAFPHTDRMLSDGLLRGEVRFGHPMRTTPTVICYSASTGESGKVWDGDDEVDRPLVLTSVSPYGFTYDVSTAPVGNHLSFHYIASAEL